LRFYHGGGLMSNWLSFFAIGLVLSSYAWALLIVLGIWFRKRFRPPPGLS
jgi:hypothetical protein